MSEETHSDSTSLGQDVTPSQIPNEKPMPLGELPAFNHRLSKDEAQKLRWLIREHASMNRKIRLMRETMRVVKNEEGGDKTNPGMSKDGESSEPVATIDRKVWARVMNAKIRRLRANMRMLASHRNPENSLDEMIPGFSGGLID